MRKIVLGLGVRFVFPVREHVNSVRCCGFSPGLTSDSPTGNAYRIARHCYSTGRGAGSGVLVEQWTVGTLEHTNSWKS